MRISLIVLSVNAPSMTLIVASSLRLTLTSSRAVRSGVSAVAASGIGGGVAAVADGAGCGVARWMLLPRASVAVDNRAVRSARMRSVLAGACGSSRTDVVIFVHRRYARCIHIPSL